MLTYGFGTRFDLVTGKQRQWIMKRGDIPRWVDNNEPVDNNAPVDESPTVDTTEVFKDVNNRKINN